MEEVKSFLNNLKLSKFVNYFEENGYDDLTMILELEEAEIKELAKDANMKKGKYFIIIFLFKKKTNIIYF